MYLSATVTINILYTQVKEFIRFKFYQKRNFDLTNTFEFSSPKVQISHTKKQKFVNNMSMN